MDAHRMIKHIGLLLPHQIFARFAKIWKSCYSGRSLQNEAIIGIDEKEINVSDVDAFYEYLIDGHAIVTQEQ